MRTHLENFLIVSVLFTLVPGVFLAFILGTQLPETVSRADLLAGRQSMLGIQIASLVPQWNCQEPATWMAKGATWMDAKAGTRDRKAETFEEYWARTNREGAAHRARGEEVVGA